MCNAQYSITDRPDSLVSKIYQRSSTSLISSTYGKQEHSGVVPDTGDRCLIKPRLFYRKASTGTVKRKTHKVEITFHIIVLVSFFFVARQPLVSQNLLNVEAS